MWLLVFYQYVNSRKRLFFLWSSWLSGWIPPVVNSGKNKYDINMFKPVKKATDSLISFSYPPLCCITLFSLPALLMLLMQNVPQANTHIDLTLSPPRAPVEKKLIHNKRPQKIPRLDLTKKNMVSLLFSNKTFSYNPDLRRRCWMKNIQ